MSLLSLLARDRSGEGLTGIGFHDDGISLARVQRDKASHVLLDVCEFAPLEAGEDHGTLLDDLISKHSMKKCSCVCVMSPDTYSLLQVEAPDVQPAELRAAVRWRIKDIIDFHIDDAVIDVFDIPGQSGRGGAKVMYVVAARASEIQRQVDLLNDAGLAIQAIDINELSLRNVVARMPQDVDGVALISFTRTSGLISLLHQGALYLTRSIPIGSDMLRQAYASSQQGSTSLTDLFDRIVLEVQRSLDYYDSHFSSPPMKHIVIAPMEQEISGMTAYLSEEFPLPLTVMDFAEFMDCTDIIPPAVQARCCATVGAALRQEDRAL